MQSRPDLVGMVEHVLDGQLHLGGPFDERGGGPRGTSRVGATQHRLDLVGSGDGPLGHDGTVDGGDHALYGHVGGVYGSSSGWTARDARPTRTRGAARASTMTG